MIKLLFALIAIAGYIANIKDYKKLSYILWSISNLYWAVYNSMHRENELSLMFSVYGMFCVYGLYRELWIKINR